MSEQRATNDPSRQESSGEEFATPAVDIAETTDLIVLVADMPGVREGDVEVLVEGDTLTIEGRVGETPPAGGEAVRREFGPKAYRRVFTLPRDLDPGGIRGKMKHGVLRLELPKRNTAGPRRFSVNP